MPPVPILRIITRLNVGGPTRHVDLLLRGLDPGRWTQVLVHGSGPQDEAPEMLEVHGEKIHVPELQREIRLAPDRRAFGRLRALIRDLRPQIVHTHQGKAGYLGRLAAAREGVPLVVHTYHGHTFAGYFGRPKAWILRRAEIRAARRSHLLLCQSSSQEGDVLEALGAAAAGKTRILEPAVDPAALVGGGGAPPIPERPAILLPARLVPIKRPERAIRLVAALRRRLDVELWIAGDGPLRSQLEQQARSSGVEDAVRFLGNRRNMADLYRAATLVLLTSDMEGTPLVLLEAMSCGVPAAAPDVGGVRDILGGAGIVLPPAGSLEQWVEALAPLLEDEAARAPLVRAGRERAGRRFHPERLCRQLDALYTEARALSPLS